MATYELLLKGESHVNLCTKDPAQQNCQRNIAISFSKWTRRAGCFEQWSASESGFLEIEQPWQVHFTMTHFPDPLRHDADKTVQEKLVMTSFDCPYIPGEWRNKHIDRGTSETSQPCELHSVFRKPIPTRMRYRSILQRICDLTAVFLTAATNHTPLTETDASNADLRPCAGESSGHEFKTSSTIDDMIWMGCSSVSVKDCMYARRPVCLPAVALHAGVLA